MIPCERLKFRLATPNTCQCPSTTTSFLCQQALVANGARGHVTGVPRSHLLAIFISLCRGRYERWRESCQGTTAVRPPCKSRRPQRSEYGRIFLTTIHHLGIVVMSTSSDSGSRYAYHIPNPTRRDQAGPFRAPQKYANTNFIGSGPHVRLSMGTGFIAKHSLRLRSEQGQLHRQSKATRGFTH